MSLSFLNPSTRTLSDATGRVVFGVRARSWPVVTVAGFGAGYLVMYNGWVQLCWLAAGLVFVAMTVGLRWILEAWVRDGWLRSVAVLLAGVVVASGLVTQDSGADLGKMMERVSGAGLLWILAALWWRVGSRPEEVAPLAKLMVAAGCVAGIAGLVGFSPHLLGSYQGHRLQNPLVYGGLNPVCTALTVGFSGMWAAVMAVRAGREAVAKRGSGGLWAGWSYWHAAQGLMLVAVFFTLSRGGVLALAAGHAVLLGVWGWRRVWKTLAVTAAAAVVFLVVGTLRTPGADAAGGSVATSMERLEQGPVARMIQRGDSSRLSIYQAGVAALQTPRDLLFGKGLWMDDDCWKCGLPSNPDHLHSAFVAALVQGGWLGLAGFLGVLAWGMRRLLWLARRGDGVWLVLAAFGVAGLVFDGQSPFSLMTMPRFEALILWMPLALGSAAYLRERQKEKPTVM